MCFPHRHLLGATAAAEVEYRKQAGPAVCTDDDAETWDRDLANLGAGRTDSVPDILGVHLAVSVEDVNNRAGCVDLAQIMKGGVMKIV